MKRRIPYVAIRLFVLPFIIWLGAYAAATSQPIHDDVSVTFRAAPGSCEVGPRVGGERILMPCRNVAHYVVGTLKLPVGSTFSVASLLDNNDAEVALVISELKAAGYRLGSSMHGGLKAK